MTELQGDSEQCKFDPQNILNRRTSNFLTLSKKTSINVSTMIPKHPRRYQRLPPDRQPWHFCNIACLISEFAQRERSYVTAQLKSLACHYPQFRVEIRNKTISLRTLFSTLFLEWNPWPRRGSLRRNNFRVWRISIERTSRFRLACSTRVIDGILWEFALWPHNRSHNVRHYTIVHFFPPPRYILLYYTLTFRSFSFANEHDWFPINFLSLHLVLECFLNVSSVR